MDLRISSIVFLATGHIDQGHLIWTELVTYAVRSSSKEQVTLPWDETRSYRLDEEGARRRLERDCKAFLKDAPDEVRQRHQAALLVALGIDAAEASAQRHMLNWDEVRATMELTRFGGHTHNHPILSQIDEASVEHEIRLCRERIESETGSAAPYFAYPNGRPSDYNDQTKAVLRRYGYDMAFSTSPGIHQAGMDRLAIRRQPTAARSLGDFAALVAGRHS
jgi:peptidoglycan/xylan/chitin deacetylase (PgdA/CDA1 family)